MDKKALLIINPRAGKMSFRNSFYSVVKTLSDADYGIEVYITKGKGDAERLAFERGGGDELIIACGGDGTLNETLSGLSRAKPGAKVGYIPCGSTNDFASSIGIPGKPVFAVKQIVEDSFVSLDLGKFNDRYFTYTASFGAFTAASYDTPQNLKNTLGHFAYILSAAKQLSGTRPVKVKVTADDYTEEGEFIYGGVSNTISIGGVYTLAEEDVVMNDGTFELIMMRRPSSPAGYVNTLLNIAARKYDDPNLLFRHVKHAVFECEEEIPYTLDGEFGGNHLRAEIRCMNNAYRINGKP